MTQEEKAKAYDEALEKARNYYNGIGPCRAKDELEKMFPQLRESEDERIRKLLVWQVYRNIEDETNDLARSVYDGIKGHDPDLEESIEDWKKCLDWLEKQKEPKHAPDDLQKSFEAGQTSIVDNPEQYGLCKKAEWSGEDEDMLNSCISSIEEAKENRYAYRETDGDTSYDHEISWLKSLRPSWKPSEQEWNDEDDWKRKELIQYLKEKGDYRTTWMTWLESLRSRPKSSDNWKPSEEQMEAMEFVIKDYREDGCIATANYLQEILDQIKKL